MASPSWRMIRRWVDTIGRYATRFMALGVLTGFVFPSLAEVAAPLLIPTLLIPLTIALTRLDWREAARYRSRPLLVAVLLAWLLVVSPAIVALALKLAPMPVHLEQGLILMAASSPIVSAVAIAFLVGLDAPLAIVLVVLATAIVPFSLPLIARALLGLELQIPLGEFMLRLGVMVGGAFAVAGVARRFVSAETIDRNRTMLDGISVVNLVIFAIAIMNGVAAFARDHTSYVVWSTVAAFLANIALQAVSVAAFWRLGTRLALTVGLCAGNCNMGLVLVALRGEAAFEIVVFFAMAQLPMYMLPAVQEPVYRRLLARPDRLSGPPAAG